MLLLTTAFLLLPVHFLFAAAWKVLVVSHSPGQDDTPALTALLPQYSSNATILFQEGTTYNIFSPLAFPVLENVEIAIEGNLTYPSSIPAIQAIVGSASYPGAWFAFKGGKNVTLRGSSKPECGWVDGHGQAWWDAQQQTNRPHGWAFTKITNGVIKNMKLWKPIAWNFATSGSVNVHAYKNKIIAVSDTNRRKVIRSTSYQTKLINEIGFSAGGTDLLFEDNFIQNGDDCLTVSSGAKNIHFRNSYCEGGHGLSIGSLGKGGQVSDVENVLIENIVMNKTLYGARFKSWTGGNGFARNITWRNIGFFDVPFPIYVTQNYWDQGLGPKPNLTSPNNTLVQDFLFDQFVGTIRDEPYVERSCISNPCWYYVPGATGKEVVIFDLFPGTATNIVAKGIFATTETGSPVAVMCNSTTVSNDVGFVCQNGRFSRTAAGW